MHFRAVDLAPSRCLQEVEIGLTRRLATGKMFLLFYISSKGNNHIPHVSRYSQVFLVVLHDSPLEFVVLLGDELEGGEVGVVGVVFQDEIAAFS